MNIRQTISTDSLLLSSLCMDVQSLHAEHHPDIFKTPKSDDFAVSFFDEMLADPMKRIFIAEENGQAIGYIFCNLIERPDTLFTYANRFLQIEHIAVRPNAQRRSVGTALMNRVEKLAQELSIAKIQLDSWDFNTSAHSFFESLGFQKFDYRFWRNL